MCVLTKSYNVCYQRFSLFTESSFLFLTGFLWLQAKKPTRPVAASVACGSQREPWLHVWPLALKRTCGCQRGLWLPV